MDGKDRFVAERLIGYERQIKPGATRLSCFAECHPPLGTGKPITESILGSVIFFFGKSMITFQKGN